MEIYAYGIDPEDVTDREKELLAEQIHRLLLEQFERQPESIGVEGHGPTDRRGDD